MFISLRIRVIKHLRNTRSCIPFPVTIKDYHTFPLAGNLLKKAKKWSLISLLHLGGYFVRLCFSSLGPQQSHSWYQINVVSRRCDVMTSHPRWYAVVFTFYIYWVIWLWYSKNYWHLESVLWTRFPAQNYLFPNKINNQTFLLGNDECLVNM